MIYVGETKHIDLRPLTGEHHRLAHYRDTFPDDDGLKLLYVTVGRVERFPDGYEGAEARSTYRRLRVFTQYIEAKIYWEYTKQWNCPLRFALQEEQEDLAGPINAQPNTRLQPSRLRDILRQRG